MSKVDMGVNISEKWKWVMGINGQTSIESKIILRNLLVKYFNKGLIWWQIDSWVDKLLFKQKQTQVHDLYTMRCGQRDEGRSV